MSSTSSGGANAGFSRSNPLVRRLAEYVDLSAAAREAIGEWDRLPVRSIEAHHDLIRQGDKPDFVYLIRRGWACRYKLLANGRRQIVDFPIAGDLCDLNLYLLDRMDHSIGAITALDVVEIHREEFETVAFRQPQLLQALWLQELATTSLQREWIVNVGARTALERIAHLLCELFTRLETVGETRTNRCAFPLTQQDLADSTGLTSVHINRSVQELRRRGLIQLSHRELTITDFDGLVALGQFDPDYLHLRSARGRER